MCGKNQRGITGKLRKGEQSFLCLTCGLDLIHIPIKLQEDISNSYRVLECTRMFEKNGSKGHDYRKKLRKREQSFLCLTHCPDIFLIHIPLHVSCIKISQTVTELWSVQDCLNKINQRGITQKLRKGKQPYCLTRCLDPIHVLIKLPVRKQFLY